ncbi:11403_t:CDS:2, partial [Racocetra fulgida]
MRVVVAHLFQIAQSKHNIVITEIKDSDPIDLRVVKILAEYLQSKSGSQASETKKEEALKEIKEILSDAANVSNSTVQVIADLAKREIAATKTWAEDAMLAQLIEAWVGLRTGGDKYQEAYYIYEEIAQSPSSNTVKVLNGQAVCNIHLGRYPEAESLLLEALNK